MVVNTVDASIPRRMSEGVYHFEAQLDRLNPDEYAGWSGPVDYACPPMNRFQQDVRGELQNVENHHTERYTSKIVEL